MSALHWICALTLALVCCVSAQPVKDHDMKVITKWRILKTFESIKKVIRDNCPNDTQIYSPADISPDCLSSALSCSNKGLKVLEFECGLTIGKKDDLNGLTEKKINDLNGFEHFRNRLQSAENETSQRQSSSQSSNPSPSPSTCNVCEMYPLKKAEEFLEDVKSLVQRW